MHSWVHLAADELILDTVVKRGVFGVVTSEIIQLPTWRGKCSCGEESVFDDVTDPTTLICPRSQLNPMINANSESEVIQELDSNQTKFDFMDIEPGTELAQEEVALILSLEENK